MSNISPELIAQFDQARAAGKALAQTEPRAVKAWYAADSERVFIELTNGVMMGFPYQLLQGLANGTPEQLAEVEIMPTGSALHWESLDADLGVAQLVSGLFGSKAWMAELGRHGGNSKSPSKAQASRDNGKRGGRPRKAVASESPVDELSALRKITRTEKVTQTRQKKQSTQEVKGQD
jgi:Protein of unknown function (DUF2442)